MAASKPTLEAEKQFWNWHWKHGDERKTTNEWKERRHAEVLKLLAGLNLSQPRILDIGCGTGFYTNKLSHHGSVTALDLSAEAIGKAKENFPHIAFYTGNIYDFSFPRKNYDVVVSQEVIDHVQDQPRFIERVAELLRPGGYLILSCANKFVMDRLRDGEFPPQPVEHIEDHLDAKALRLLLSQRFQVYKVMSIIPIGSRGILRITNSYKINKMLQRIIPQRLLDRLKEKAGLGYQLIVYSKKR